MDNTEQCRRWRQANPEKYALYQKEYRAKNPDKFRKYAATAKAKRANTEEK